MLAHYLSQAVLLVGWTVVAYVVGYLHGSLGSH